MAQRKTTDDSYELFTDSVKQGALGNFYIFHGEERYLLEHSLIDIRKRLCPDGLSGFNYRRLQGKSIKMDELEEAINTLPVFADRTLIEVHDFDIFANTQKAVPDNSFSPQPDSGISPIDDPYDAPLQTVAESIRDYTDDSTKPVTAKKARNPVLSDKQDISSLFTDLPDYVCVVLIYDTVLYNPDKRKKADKDILSNAQVVEFSAREQSKLTKWIIRHFEAAGKQISKTDAEYMILITDGFMSTLINEVGKVSAYADNVEITRSDIDAVVVPVLNAFAYKLTDAILLCKHSLALSLLDELIQMREPAHKVMFSISAKMRQFLTARVCIENNLSKSDLMDMCGIRYDFQASTLMSTARSTTLARCREAVLLCAETAYTLNIASDPESSLIELITKLAHNAS